MAKLCVMNADETRSRAATAADQLAAAIREGRDADARDLLAEAGRLTALLTAGE
jgi:hypothetical protein